MTQRARVQRPPLQRTAPIRNLGKAFDQAARKAASGPADQPRDAEAASGLEDAVSEGVRLGYGVIEDQIRQAQDLAGKLNPGSYGLFGSERAGSAEEIRSLLDRLLRSYGDLTNVWLQMLNAMLGNADILNAILGKEKGETEQAQAPSADHTRAANGAAGAGPAIALSISADGRVETDLRFFGGRPATTALVVQDLRSRENGAPPLEDLAVIQAAGDEPARIVVKVPSEQPPGLYQGLILDQRTDAPIGVLGITVR